ncbi:hypothetical protein CHLNCDRAFT_18675 [Chlorella variabilis]|uniref:Uncharacterized protein n=1 Tax=Chlorella variabilis TaxID=554065 RepID=E1Z216_CHLVA|nr:hypothetical protein CHLNCDRAFT_18675 [Chlorella variabilis]EFN59917.1 hypothetical protein CHLNCDRAFT_18675 [Chlorella variabilis]|eukprot:XP_005852019.1 hypothetical protein CHLNCDRAFT_18675 [Chlorella variabilis]
MSLLQFLLRSLKYPRADSFNPDDPGQFQAVLVWLENTKVRQYPMDGRQQLQSGDPAEWRAALQKYLADLECPIKPDAANHRAVLQWLLTHAVGLEYTDASQQFDQVAQRVEAEAGPPEQWTEPALPPLPDITTDAVKAALLQLQQLLHQQRQGQAAPGGAEAGAPPAAAASGASQRSAAAAMLAQYPLGFSTGDAAADLGATILRMLYIKDLRALQTLVDSAIVQVQEYTANPRTDASLGKVGR